ncbi:MAG: hypothetical protein HYT80_00880 [Euryarchaeota archaeon]|nr:hypothetical protein [Euryarchaeota archaeon]
MRRDDHAQLNIIESILVGAIVFTAVAATAVFRLPTSPASFQQAELERIGADALAALIAKVPDTYSGDAILDNCNISPCPYKNELERIISLAMDFNNPAGAVKTDPLSDFFDQALPEGAFYVVYFSNAEGEVALYPTFRAPPAADVVVSHAIMGPVWTQQARASDGTTLGFEREIFYLRPGEATDFDPDGADNSISVINDPLGRTTDQAGTTIEERFTELQSGQILYKVPLATPYGTYKLDIAQDRYFAVVPLGVAGPGSLVYPIDLDDPSSLSGTAYDVFSLLEFNGDTLYLDIVDDNKVTADDLRLSYYEGGGSTFPPGTFVGGADQDAVDMLPLTDLGGNILYSDDNASGTLDDGEAVYLDEDTNGLDAGDWRLSRAGIYPIGTKVGAADEDLLDGRPTRGPLTAKVRYLEVTGVGLSAGDTVYLDLNGQGQVDGLEPFDVHLTKKGTVTLRYVYDIRLVIWFGV